MRKLTTKFFVTLLLAGSLIFIPLQFVQAQTDDKADANRAKVAGLIEKGDSAGATKLMQELQPKVQDYNHILQPNFNVFFEEIKACGFYPQETRLECMIEIKRAGGYAGPVGSPGSIENVLFCVDWNNNGAFDQSEAVGIGSMAIHDESAGAQPSWQYAVYRDFDPRGGVRTSNTGNVANTTTNGPTLKARAILSWFVHPTGCNFIPVWGNAVNFRIRFDPVR